MITFPLTPTLNQIYIAGDKKYIFDGRSWSGLGVSIQSLKGDTGLQGPVGAASTVAGPTGPTGAASTVAGPTGSTGATGLDGAASTVAGPTGPTGPAGAASTVPGITEARTVAIIPAAGDAALQNVTYLGCSAANVLGGYKYGDSFTTAFGDFLYKPHIVLTSAASQALSAPPGVWIPSLSRVSKSGINLGGFKLTCVFGFKLEWVDQQRIFVGLHSSTTTSLTNGTNWDSLSGMVGITFTKDGNFGSFNAVHCALNSPKIYEEMGSGFPKPLLRYSTYFKVSISNAPGSADIALDVTNLRTGATFSRVFTTDIPTFDSGNPLTFEASHIAASASDLEIMIHSVVFQSSF